MKPFLGRLQIAKLVFMYEKSLNADNLIKKMNGYVVQQAI